MKKMLILSFAVLAMVFVSCTASTEEVVETEAIDTTNVLTGDETSVDVTTDTVVADTAVVAE